MALSLSMTRHKTGLWFISVYQSDGVTPQSLVGSTLWFHALVQTVAIDKSSPSSGITISNTAGGLNCATLQIEPADTATIPGGTWQGAAELTLQSGSEDYELASGTLTVSQNVNTP